MRQITEPGMEQQLRDIARRLVRKDVYPLIFRGERYQLESISGRPEWLTGYNNGFKVVPLGEQNRLFEKIGTSRDDFLAIYNSERRSYIAKKRMAKRRLTGFCTKVLARHGVSGRNSPEDNLGILESLSVEDLAEDIRAIPGLSERYGHPGDDITPKVRVDKAFVAYCYAKKAGGS